MTLEQVNTVLDALGIKSETKLKLSLIVRDPGGRELAVTSVDVRPAKDGAKLMLLTAKPRAKRGKGARDGNETT